MKLTPEQIKELRAETREVNRGKLKDRLLAIFRLFPEGLTAPQAHGLDRIYNGSHGPESSVRARCSEMSKPIGPLEITARTRTGQYQKKEHYYKIRNYEN